VFSGRVEPQAGSGFTVSDENYIFAAIEQTCGQPMGHIVHQLRGDSGHHPITWPNARLRGMRWRGKRQEWVQISHCAFMPEMRYGRAMTRRTISTVYYYPDEVGIG